MSKLSTISKGMGMKKNRNSLPSCSTPEPLGDSPSQDSDSLCGSEAASPVPFLCTQDGAEGETDVVWNYYTPKSEHTANSRIKNSTPLSRKERKPKPKLIQKPPPRRRNLRSSQKKTELFQELLELNQNVHQYIAKKPDKAEKQASSEDDIFSDSSDHSPRSGLRNGSRCLRRNLLTSKFTKPEADTALESDDSITECLIRASQAVEDTIMQNDLVPPRPQSTKKNLQHVKPGLSFNMDGDSMDAILNSINLESPVLSKVKKCDSPRFNNDSFDSFVANLNDSTLEKMTQSNKNDTGQQNDFKDKAWKITELIVHDGSPSKSILSRHNSMPESPSVTNINKPSTSGMAFGRYNSMPYNKNLTTNTAVSPVRCTPEEIKRKYQQARERFLAKRALPFTQQNTQTIQQNKPMLPAQKKAQFVPKVATANVNNNHVSENQQKPNIIKTNPSANNALDIKLMIERKRQEALERRRRRQQNK